MNELKDRLQQLQSDMLAEYHRARALLEDADGEIYYVVRTIAAGMSDDIEMLGSIIKDIPADPDLDIEQLKAAGQQPLGLEMEQ